MRPWIQWAVDQMLSPLAGPLPTEAETGRIFPFPSMGETRASENLHLKEGFGGGRHNNNCLCNTVWVRTRSAIRPTAGPLAMPTSRDPPEKAESTCSRRAGGWTLDRATGGGGGR